MFSIPFLLAVDVGVLLAMLAFARMASQPAARSGALPWAILIVLFPYVTVPLYLLLGGRKRRPDRAASAALGRDPDACVAPADAAPLDRLLRTYGVGGASAGNTVGLLTDGEETFRSLLALIDGAERTLDLEVFILHPDATGQAVVQALARRAASGVRVRLLLDGMGSLGTWAGTLRPLVDAGGRAAVFKPLLRYPLSDRADVRNHRKMAVADGARVLAGGINVAHDYLGPTPDAARWRDLAFRLDGPAARPYAALFEADWAYATREPCQTVEPARSAGGGTTVAQVVASGPDVEGDPLYSAVLAAVFAARSSVRIVTPYFVPDDALVHALTIASRRGVDVRVLVPDVSNHRTADLARGPALREIQAAGGTVLHHAREMVHAKAVVVDRTVAVVGSANVDMRSLFYNYEVALLLHDAPAVDAVAAWADALAAGADVGVRPVGRIRDIAESLVRLFAPML